MYIKKGRKSANTKSLKTKHNNRLVREEKKRLVVPKDKIRDLALNLSVRDAHKAALCLLIVDIAARAIAESKTEGGDLNLRLIRQMVEDQTCGSIQRMIKAIIAAIEPGAEGAAAASRTITYFLEFVFEWAPSRRMAAGLYDRKLKEIRRAS